MIFQYHLDKSDYLHYLFYSTSRSKKVKKRRSLNKFILSVMYLVMGYYLYKNHGMMPALFFFLLCVPLYFLYNVFERKQYLKHFNKFIDYHFKDNIDRKSTIQIEDDRFLVVDDEELWHSYDDIEEVHETNQLMVVQLKNGVAIL